MLPAARIRVYDAATSQEIGDGAGSVIRLVGGRTLAAGDVIIVAAHRIQRQPSRVRRPRVPRAGGWQRLHLQQSTDQSGPGGGVPFTAGHRRFHSDRAAVEAGANPGAPMPERVTGGNRHRLGRTMRRRSDGPSPRPQRAGLRGPRLRPPGCSTWPAGDSRRRRSSSATFALYSWLERSRWSWAGTAFSTSPPRPRGSLAQEGVEESLVRGSAGGCRPPAFRPTETMPAHCHVREWRWGS